MNQLQRISFAPSGLAGADIFNTGPSTDLVNRAKAKSVGLLIQHKSGDTGAGTIVAKAASNAAGDNAEAIECKVRVASSGNQFGPVANVTTSGYSFPAGSSPKQVLLIIDKNPADKPFVFFDTTETVDSPVVADTCLVLGDLAWLTDTQLDCLS